MVILNKNMKTSVKDKVDENVEKAANETLERDQPGRIDTANNLFYKDNKRWRSITKVYLSN